MAVGEFIATSNYADIFSFLKLGTRATVHEIRGAAEKVCGLTWQELKEYNENLQDPISDEYELAQYCFRSVFAYQILRNGYGFKDESRITAVDVLNGQKLGWALGSMLYEINTLPWEFHPKLKVKGPKNHSEWFFLGLPSTIDKIVGDVGHGSVLKQLASDHGPLLALLGFLVTTTSIVIVIIERRRRRRDQYIPLGAAVIGTS